MPCCDDATLVERSILRSGARGVRLRIDSNGARAVKTLSLGFVLLVALHTALPAQAFYGIAGGLNFVGRVAPPDPQLYERSTSGFAMQASVGRQFGDRFGVRLDAFVNHFAVLQPPRFAGVMCPMGSSPPCGSPPGSAGTTNPVGVSALSTSAFLILDPPEYRLRMYLIAGAGAYYFYQHPSIEGAVRPGLSAGGGFTLRVEGRSQIFVEARYNDILGSPSQRTWLVPLTFGFRF